MPIFLVNDPVNGDRIVWVDDENRPLYSVQHDRALDTLVFYREGFEDAVQVVTEATRVPLTTVASSTDALDLDTTSAAVFDVTLDDDCTLAFSGAPTAEAASFTLILRQDGDGLHDVTWPAEVAWDSGVAPTLTTTALNVSVLRFLTADAGDTWIGELVADEVAVPA